jgi:hypothetical protein
MKSSPRFGLFTLAVFGLAAGVRGGAAESRNTSVKAVVTEVEVRLGESPAAAVSRRFRHQGHTYQLYPTRLAACPELPSPVRLENGLEVVIVITSDDRYTLVPVTVENGSPLNYAQRQWGKGRQLEVDAADFPTLAATGRHSENELRQTKRGAGAGRNRCSPTRFKGCTSSKCGGNWTRRSGRC